MNPIFCDITSVTENEFQLWFSQMSEARQEKCRRISSIKGKKCCIAADHLARTALAEHLNCTYKDIEIKISDTGKPYIKGNRFCFSISHSDTAVVCLCSPNPVGVDLEKIRTVPKALWERTCSKEELKYIEEIAAQEEQDRRFLEIWTKKEAIYKLKGTVDGTYREIPALCPEKQNIRLKTETREGYILTVAEYI